MKDLEKKVAFVFYCYEKESADLKIRLRYDGLKQSQFFQAILRLYISQDPEMLKIVEKIKLENRIMGKKKIKKTRELFEKGEKMMEDLGITDSDKQKIFDLIESAAVEYE